MSYNNCCDPCQGYYEPYQYYEPSVENWHPHLPHISIPNPIEAIKKKAEELAESELLPIIQDFLTKNLNNNYATYVPEQQTLVVHTALVQNKLKEDLENLLVSKYGSLAKEAFDFVWKNVEPKAASVLEQFATTHAQSLIDAVNKTNAFSGAVISHITVTENYGIGSWIKDKAKSAGAIVKKAVSAGMDAGKEKFIAIITEHIKTFIQEALECKDKDTCLKDYDEKRRVLLLHKNRVLDAFWKKVAPHVQGALAQGTCNVASKFIKGFEAKDYPSCKRENTKAVEYDVCCGLFHKYAGAIFDKILEKANEYLASFRGYFTHKPTIYGLLRQVDKVEEANEEKFELEMYMSESYDPYYYEEPYTYNSYCDC